MPEMVPDIGERVRDAINCLERLPENPYRDEPLMDRARAALGGLLGPVIIKEARDGICAQGELGRACMTLGAGRGT